MLIYNVPTGLIEAFKDKNMVVRSSDASEIARSVDRLDPSNVVWLQILSLASDCDPIANLEPPIPVDLVIERGPEDYPLLYDYAKLLRTRPVRVVIPLFPGFRRAVRLATSLGFSVMLDLGHSDQSIEEEFFETMNDYLHSCTVNTPIDCFHSILIYFCHGHPNTIWTIQEEDPEFYRYVTDEGKVVVSRHLSHVLAERQGLDFLQQIKLDLLLEKGECSVCAFFEVCHGYFRYFNRNITCHLAKRIFQALKDAGEDLKRDMADSLRRGQGDRT